MEVTNQCEDAMELLDAKIEILRNLEHLTEVNSVFNTGSSETIQCINDWGNDSRLEEFHKQDFDRRPPREERPSNIAAVGSPEQLGQGGDGLPTSQAASLVASSVANPMVSLVENVAFVTCTGTIPKTSTGFPGRPTSEFIPTTSVVSSSSQPNPGGIQTTAGGFAGFNLLGSNYRSTLGPSDLSSTNTVIPRPPTTSLFRPPVTSVVQTMPSIPSVL